MAIPITKSIPNPQFPDLNAKGKPLCTRDNLAYLMEQYDVRLFWNTECDELGLHIPGRNRDLYFDLCDRWAIKVTELKSLCGINEMKSWMIEKHLLQMADDAKRAGEL